MPRTYTVESGGVSYRGDTAPANDQFEAMHIAMRTGLITHIRSDPSEMALVAMFGALKYEDVQRLDKLLLSGKVQREDDDVPVGKNLFADNVQDYYLLIGYAVKENIGPFWKLQRPATKPEAVEPTQ